MKAQYGILRFAKYKGPEIVTVFRQRGEKQKGVDIE